MKLAEISDTLHIAPLLLGFKQQYEGLEIEVLFYLLYLCICLTLDFIYLL